jgi:HRAS-like suppressor 3
MNLRIGDHLVTSCTGYTHHGIYIGDGQVIHYAGLAHGLHAGSVEIITLDGFGNGNKIRVYDYAAPAYDGGDAVARAHSRLG